MNLDNILKQEQEPQNAEDFALATVDTVESDGVSLIFDGSSDSGGKLYKCNSDVLLSEGDRVRVKKDSGSYIVEYHVGTPMERYPIPSGGTDGQVLTKDGSDPYAVKWADAGGGTSGGLPSGGTAGQLLMKSSATDYDAEWKTIIPSGGSAGQVLAKTNTSDYQCSWQDVSATKLGSSSYYVHMSGTNFVPSGNLVSLGSAGYPWTGVYLNGAVRIGTSSYGCTLGFFGTTPVARQTVASSATVATLITALKAYGLIL